MPSNPTGTTLTCVAVAVEIVGACAIVQAWTRRAVLNFNFAIDAPEAGSAFASVRALARVRASAAVVARLVICAEIQVLIAEQAAPALLADAFPLFRASSMHASWIHFTFVTIWSLPSGLASVVGEETENAIINIMRDVIRFVFAPGIENTRELLTFR